VTAIMDTTEIEAARDDRAALDAALLLDEAPALYPRRITALPYLDALYARETLPIRHAQIAEVRTQREKFEARFETQAQYEARAETWRREQLQARVEKSKSDIEKYKARREIALAQKQEREAARKQQREAQERREARMKENVRLWWKERLDAAMAKRLAEGGCP
jgi:hypothetical protein